MKMLARTYTYWPGIDGDVDRVVKNCSACQHASKMPTRNELTPWPAASRPMERVHIDYAGPIKGIFYLVIVDAFSRWPEIFETKSTTSTATTRLLQKFFSEHGYPELLVSDNGTQFSSQEFEDYCQKRRICHIRTPPFHPQSNGLRGSSIR